jgi:HJR/Mrr/RecB family endonuclease
VIAVAEQRTVLELCAGAGGQAQPRGSDPTTSLRLAALDCASRGMAVFPCLVGRKEPRWRAWEARATRDPAEIRRVWGRAPYNIGVACGPSNLVVVDLDVPKEAVVVPAEWQRVGVATGVEVLVALAMRAGEPFPATMTVATPRGGRHLVFRAPANVEVRNSAGTVGWCVDVRAAGGYVLGVGSVIQGITYRLVNAAPVAELPAWLQTAITRPRAWVSEAQWRGSGAPQSDEDRRRYAARALEHDVVAALTTAALRSGLGALWKPSGPSPPRWRAPRARRYRPHLRARVPLGHRGRHTVPMPKPAHRSPSKRSRGLEDDLEQVFAQLPWWAPVVALAVLVTGLLVAGDMNHWPWSTTKLLIFSVMLIIGATGAAGQVEKRRLHKLLVSTRRLDDLRALSWSAFEELILAAYRARGWTGSLTRSGADGGVDVILQKNRDTVFVQCKHWKANTVGVESVRALKGSMATEHVAKGIFVATGSFTAEAQRYAQSSGITLVDGPEVLELVGEVTGEVPGPANPVGGEGTTAPTASPSCPRCADVMVVRHGSHGIFWGCPRYPSCRGTLNITR